MLSRRGRLRRHQAWRQRNLSEYNGLNNSQAFNGLGPGGGSAPFKPSGMTGLVRWFDPTVNIYTDLGSTACTTDGDLVEQWNDQSSNAANATQTSSGSRPVYRTNVQNSLPMVGGNSGTSVLNMSATAALFPFTIYIVGKHPSGVVWAPVGSSGSGAPGTTRVLRYSDNNLYITLAAGNQASTADTTPSAFILRVRMKSDHHVLVRSTAYSEVDLGSFGTDTFSIDRLIDDQIHGTATGSTSRIGDIILTDNDTPTSHATEDTNCINYLKTKWSLTF